jgi:hypothetical protein
MTGPSKKRSARPATKTLQSPMQMRVALTGDRRLAENLILEVRAMAARCGLEPPTVEVASQPRVGAKVKLPSSRKAK